MNDDGYSDVVISAYGADEAYVFYGAPTFSSGTFSLTSLSGTAGFIISTGGDGDAVVVAAAGVRAKTYENLVHLCSRSQAELLARFCSNCSAGTGRHIAYRGQ